AVLDLAYAVRQVLHECKLAKAGVCGFLIHATSQRPAEEELARLNVYTTLSELQHYSQRFARYPGDPAHGLAPASPGLRPFDDCYVVHLGERLETAELQSSINRFADYLYVNIATTVGAFLERWRQGSRSLVVNEEDCPPLRVFGHHRYSFA